MAANKRFQDKTSQDSNPDAGTREVRFGRDVKTISDSIIGFINRDEQITSKLPMPAVASSLGRDFRRMIRERINTTNWTSKPWWDHVSSACPGGEAVPGLMTLYFTPVVAAQDQEGFNVTQQSYLSKWMAARNLDNMTKNWQPGDMQFVDVALGYIKMYLSVGARALMCVRDVAQKSDNKYYNKVAFLKAMGFEFTEKGADLHFDNMWSYWNKAIISFINSNAWLRYSYPGINRWAALCEGIYRDTPHKTDYAQFYLFMPKYMAEYSEVYDTSDPPKKLGWQIDWKRNTNGDPIHWRTLYANASETDPDARGYAAFIRFTDHVHALLKAVFYNDDVKDIIATLNAIAARNLGNELSDSNRFDFQRLGFAPESDQMSAPILYDSAMLIAIQNATINTSLVPSEAFIDPKTGNMVQSLHLLTDPFSTAAGHSMGAPGEAGAVSSWVPKVINFPNFVPTQCDIINATQWTLALSGTSLGTHAGADTDDTVPSWYVGSDFISDCEVIVMADDPDTGVIATDLSLSSSYKVVKYTGVYVAIASYSGAGTYMTDHGSANDIVRYQYDYESAYQLAQQFALAPMCQHFVVQKASGNWRLAYYGPIVQSEVYFIADGRDLANLHSQWKANFWGYPIYNTGGEGRVDLTVSADSPTTSFFSESGSSEL